MQTYEEYLETMRAYNFYPMDRELWQSWQIYYHGYFKEESAEVEEARSRSPEDTYAWRDAGFTLD